MGTVTTAAEHDAPRRLAWRNRRRRTWPPALIGGAALLVLFGLLALLPGAVAPYDPLEVLDAPLLAPSSTYLLGTDEIGRDVLSRVIYAARGDLFVSLSATAVAFALGTSIGLAVGYRRGVSDTVVMRLVDLLLAFPGLVLLLFLVAVFGSSFGVVVIGLGATMAPAMLRIARGTGLALRTRPYVEACLIVNAKSGYILRRHVLPNALPPLLVATSVMGAGAILATASLSYLGLGIQPPAPTWGGMLTNAYVVVGVAPLYGIVPGICITLLAYCYMLIGRGLQDYFAAHGVAASEGEAS